MKKTIIILIGLSFIVLLFFMNTKKQSIKFKNQTIYYSSFAGYKTRFKPINEITETEASSKEAYYRCHYDERGNLFRYEKFLNNKIYWETNDIFDDNNNLIKSTTVNFETGNITTVHYDKNQNVLSKNTINDQNQITWFNKNTSLEAQLRTIATKELNYPFNATETRENKIKKNWQLVKVGMQQKDVMTIMDLPDEIKPLYEPVIKNGKQIGYTHWYLIQRLKETGSLNEKAEKLVRISYDFDDIVTSVDKWGF